MPHFVVPLSVAATLALAFRNYLAQRCIGCSERLNKFGLEVNDFILHTPTHTHTVGQRVISVFDLFCLNKFKNHAFAEQQQ